VRFYSKSRTFTTLQWTPERLMRSEQSTQDISSHTMQYSREILLKTGRETTLQVIMFIKYFHPNGTISCLHLLVLRRSSSLSHRRSCLLFVEYVSQTQNTTHSRKTLTVVLEAYRSVLVRHLYLLLWYSLLH
jgi:hypothetical protein